MLENFLRFWSKEHSLSALLLVIVVELFIIIPLTGGGRFIDLSADLVFSFILLAGLHSMAGSKAARVLRGRNITRLFTFLEKPSNWTQAARLITIIWASP